MNIYITVVQHICCIVRVGGLNQNIIFGIHYFDLTAVHQYNFFIMFILYWYQITVKIFSQRDKPFQLV